MRLPVNRQASRFTVLALSTAMALGGLIAAPLLARQTATPPPAPTGPAADYPMVLGAPFTVEGTTFTPADTMNIDQVGYAAIEASAGPGATIAHRTLPLPSYVEVTSLKTGRTILARVERRGPMSGPDLFGLSPAAAAQLGAANGPDSRTPVRVRRVNPPEFERALLRTGQTAPLRMDTPMSLVNVLLRKLDPALVSPPPADPAPAASAQKGPMQPVEPKPAGKVATVAAPTHPPVPKTAVAPAKAGAHPEPAVKPALTPTPKPEPAPKPAAKGKTVVQVGAFSTRHNAETAARQVGGTVTPVGKLFRVRITGFASPAAAAGALAKAKGAGYSDARIQRAD